MNQGRIIVITGSPGTGKTTTASIVAKESNMDAFKFNKDEIFDIKLEFVRMIRWSI